MFIGEHSGLISSTEIHQGGGGANRPLVRSSILGCPLALNSSSPGNIYPPCLAQLVHHGNPGPDFSFRNRLENLFSSCCYYVALRKPADLNSSSQSLLNLPLLSMHAHPLPVLFVLLYFVLEELSRGSSRLDASICCLRWFMFAVCLALRPLTLLFVAFYSQHQAQHLNHRQPVDDGCNRRRRPTGQPEEIHQQSGVIILWS